LEQVADATRTVESLRLEFEPCQRELRKSRRRMGGLERSEALLAWDN
jgi:hypothetical protein